MEDQYRIRGFIEELRSTKDGMRKKEDMRKTPFKPRIHDTAIHSDDNFWRSLNRDDIESLSFLSLKSSKKLQQINFKQASSNKPFLEPVPRSVAVIFPRYGKSEISKSDRIAETYYKQQQESQVSSNKMAKQETVNMFRMLNNYQPSDAIALCLKAADNEIMFKAAVNEPPQKEVELAPTSNEVVFPKSPRPPVPIPTQQVPLAPLVVLSDFEMEKKLRKIDDVMELERSKLKSLER